MVRPQSGSILTRRTRWMWSFLGARSCRMLWWRSVWGEGQWWRSNRGDCTVYGCLDIKRFLDGVGRNVGGRWWSVPFGASPMLSALSKVVAFQPVSLFVELVWSDVLGEANERESKAPIRSRTSLEALCHIGNHLSTWSMHFAVFSFPKSPGPLCREVYPQPLVVSRQQSRALFLKGSCSVRVAFACVCCRSVLFSCVSRSLLVSWITAWASHWVPNSVVQRRSNCQCAFVCFLCRDQLTTRMFRSSRKRRCVPRTTTRSVRRMRVTMSGCGSAGRLAKTHLLARHRRVRLGMVGRHFEHLS